MSKISKLSGMQKDVLGLYRQCLREIRKKPVENQHNFQAFARAEFQKNLHLDRKDFATVEYLVRKGKRQMEMYAAPGITNIHG